MAGDLCPHRHPSRRRRKMRGPAFQAERRPFLCYEHARVGNYRVMVKSIRFVATPLLTNQTYALSGLAIRLAGTLAKQRLAQTNSEESVVWFQCTTEPGWRPSPKISSLIPEEPFVPAATEDGASTLIFCPPVVWR